MLEKLFKLKENNTSVKTEVVAGVTTFRVCEIKSVNRHSMISDGAVSS